MSVFCQNYTINEEQSSINILGSSTVHDWDVEVQKISGDLILERGTFIVTSLKIEIASGSLKGGKKAMNKKIYKALKCSEFEKIIFINDDSQIVERISNEESSLKLNGKLTLAGITEPIQLIVNLKQRSDNIILSGAIALNMKDYSINPPKAFFGTLKTNEVVSIKFFTVFNNAKKTNNN